MNAAQTSDGKTALHWASQYGNLGVAKFLLAAGVDKTAVDSSGRSPFSLASGHFKSYFQQIQRH